jgi:DNA-binding response OmpR family regulator
MTPLIFVVDPSPERRIVLQRALEQANYTVEVFATTHAIEMAEQKLPSLIIAAIRLPDGSGTELRDKVRRHPSLSSTPVMLFGDSRFYKSSVVNDDECLVFPFARGELVTAVEALLQRAVESTPAAGSSFSEKVDIVIDPFAMKISVRGKDVSTTALEFRLLDYLARHHGKVFSRDALLDAVWGDLRFVTPRSVDACIRRIRRKIEPESSFPHFLKTIRGTGYKLEAEPTWKMAGGACQCKTCAVARSRASGVPSEDLGRALNRVGRSASC